MPATIGRNAPSPPPFPANHPPQLQPSHPFVGPLFPGVSTFIGPDLPSGLLHRRPRGGFASPAALPRCNSRTPAFGRSGVLARQVALPRPVETGGPLAERRAMAGRAGTGSGRPLPVLVVATSRVLESPGPGRGRAWPAWDHADRWDVVRARPPGSLVRAHLPGSRRTSSAAPGRPSPWRDGAEGGAIGRPCARLSQPRAGLLAGWCTRWSGGVGFVHGPVNLSRGQWMSCAQRPTHRADPRTPSTHPGASTAGIRPHQTGEWRQ
jgi:hypothetical protein